MIKTLLWKEWREKRLFIFLLFSVLVLGYILSINHIIVPKSQRFLDEILIFIMAMLSLFIGGNAIAPENRAGTMNFTFSQPVSRTKIWAVKYSFTLFIFIILILLNLGLEYILNPPLYSPSFPFSYRTTFQAAMDGHYYDIWWNLLSKLMLYSVLMFGAFFFSCFMRSSLASIGLFSLVAGVIAYLASVVESNNSYLIVLVNQFLFKSGLISIIFFTLGSWLVIIKLSKKNIVVSIAAFLVLSFAVVIFNYSFIKEQLYTETELQSMKAISKYIKEFDKLEKFNIKNVNDPELLFGFAEIGGRNTTKGSYRSSEMGTSYKKAISLSADNPIYYTRFFLYYIDSRGRNISVNDYPSQIKCLNKLDSNNAAVDYISAYFQFKCGDNNKAIELINKALNKKLNTYDAEAQQARVNLMKYLGIPDKDAVLIDSNYFNKYSITKDKIIVKITELLKSIADAYVVLYQYDKAEKYYKILLEIDKKHGGGSLFTKSSIYKNLENIYKNSSRNVPKYIEDGLKSIKQELESIRKKNNVVFVR